MLKVYTILFSTLLIFTSCETVLEGMVMALESYNYGLGYGYGNYATSSTPSYDYSTAYSTGYGSNISNYPTYSGYTSSSSDIQIPEALNPYRYADAFNPVYTTDANGNLMVSYPGAAKAISDMNNAVQTQINSTINTVGASGDPYSSYTIQSLNAQAYSNNKWSQWEQQMATTPRYVVDESTTNNNASNTSSYPSGSTMSTAKQNIQDFKNRHGYKDCNSCHGSKKCNTCNGKGWINHTYTNTSGDCPNCTNGVCSRCSGTGQIWGVK